MIGYWLTRSAGFVATFLVAAAIIFFALDLLPGDTARFILGIDATPEAVGALREQLSLDSPSPIRFLGWIGGMIVGDFGISPTQGQPIGQMIAGRLGVTIPLTLLAVILSAGIGLPLGVIAARRRGSFVDIALMALARLGGATLGFWLGMLLVLLFSVTLRWLPPGGFVPWNENAGAALASLLLPALALALPQAAILAQAMRAALVEAQDSEFIRTARAQGLTLREAIWRHGLRHAVLSVIAIAGMQFAYLVAASVIIENVFYLPGLGRLILDAIGSRDLIVVRAGLAVLVLAIVVTLFVFDVLRAVADPRLRAWSTQ